MSSAMKLYEIRQTIIDSYSDYWNVVHGPMFNYNLGNTGDHATVFGWHDRRAVFMDDVRIALDIGMDVDTFGSRDEWTPEWANSFPDAKASEAYVDVLFNGSLVDRVRVAYVDGSRAVLPVPEFRNGELIVMDWPYQVARLVDDIEGRREFESYFARTGIRKWDA